MKRILFLGGAPTQIPPIRYALKEGHYVITCDYLPDNPGHKLAHEYHNVSTTDKAAVLELATRLKIDGIVAYASDPSAPTAAFVSEKLGLPGNPYASVEILARKDLFRSFLAENGFNVPRSKSFYDMASAGAWLNEIGVPVFVKPVDSSGSKGVTHLQNLEDFESSFAHALAYSREKKVVIEERIVKAGYQVAGDGFVVDGSLVFRCWADEHFDKLCNGLVPIGQTFPTSHADNLLEVAHKETQRLLTLLGMKTGALNFDFVFSEDGKFYFLELGPRNGGCLIPEVIRYSTTVDLIQYTVDAALGLECKELAMKKSQGYWSSYMVHALEEGTFKELWVSDRAKRYIVEQDIQVRPGDKVRKFGGSNDTLGTMILQYPTMGVMLDMIENMEQDIRVITE
ncbi:carbamoyl-phosphate-synthetase [Hydrocarboniclastica marina]|uniref:Carbamoyl-phosphate-synthetase n=1 Tax=Hydrocarboniclastica marina TaxID=2259620 RepID=A0A4P7XHF4_9ALTE|nr:carbamoyl-phosphate-synthetase [Hydrocarboniclastica marina]MAM00607.1 carbamoyl-phosphate-synthetase [Alteromonadaceae bacterium]QCF26469.1 carbamoyl-phosphate-synthetase [Hydrocarboniclastica marina]|tara:strand:+ start:4143 stop:5336 length:1194 start_codon:yes stop_codon:yes gene_type:complete